MDAYVFLALVIIILLLGLMLFVVYKESGWKFVKEDEHRGHHSEREKHRWYHERNKPHNHY
jgi:hypothetical protein